MMTWTNTGPLRTLSVVICALLVVSSQANDNVAHTKHNKVRTQVKEMIGPTLRTIVQLGQAAILRP